MADLAFRTMIAAPSSPSDKEVLSFGRTSSLFSYLRSENVLDRLSLFNDSYLELPKGNFGYVLLVDGEVAGAASIYDEMDGTYLNELFEILPEFRGHGLSRYLYEHIKEDLQPDRIHGFATSDTTQRVWEHLGQVCIDPDCREMMEILDGQSIGEYLIEERPELVDQIEERLLEYTFDNGQRS